LSSCKKTTKIDVSSTRKIDSTEQHTFSKEKPDRTEIRTDSLRIEPDEENGVDGDDLKNLFALDDDELQQVFEIYHSLKEKHPDSTSASRESYADLVNNWIPLELDNGKLYVSEYCELQKRWILADSMLIEFYQDGPAASLILEVKKQGNDYQI
jgi:hypothetical protein